MKTNKNLAKIVSKGTALVLCFAILLFALLLMLWGIATPAHVQAYPFATRTFTIPSTLAVTAITTTSASVSVDSSSYKVGDTITVSGTGFPATTAVTVELQSSDGATTTTLGTDTTGIDGSFTNDYTVPAHPLNSVVVIATAGTVTATSSSFTVKAKATATPKPKPTPVPTSLPTTTTYYPPAALASTPTPVPTATATPTPVPTDTPTPVPSPTVAPLPTAAPVVVNQNTSPFANLPGGRLPLILVIGLGALVVIAILFLVGRMLLRRFLSPDSLPDMSPSGAPPWMRPQGNSIPANTMANGIPFAQTMPFDSSFPPGNGGFAPGPGNAPQQVPFNSPFGPSNGGFAPDPNAPQPQPVPFGGPYQPSNSSGFAPTNIPQEPFPPDNWLVPPNQ